MKKYEVKVYITNHSSYIDCFNTDMPEPQNSSDGSMIMINDIDSNLVRYFSPHTIYSITFEKLEEE